MAAQDFERIQSYLKKDAGNGSSLYNHLSNVLLTLTRDAPANALEQFEAISAKIKQQSAAQTVFRELPAIKTDSHFEVALLETSKQFSQLLKPNRDGDEVPEAVSIPDILRQAELFEAAGRGFGREEAYYLSLSIRQLATAQDLTDVRLFGKIFGTQQDYYIVECKLQNWPEEEDGEESKNEPWGTGANSYAYFVTNSVTGKWERLPRVQSQQIILARQMRRYFTGDLNAKVYGFPRFPWTEKEYLRAQIARIAAATLIAPRGAYNIGDDEAVAVDEEFQGTSVEELITPDGWTHYRPHLLKQGRVEPWVAPEKDEDDEGDEPEPQEEPEEALPPLGAVSADEVPKVPAVWSFRSSGQDEHAVASAQSNIWPGAVAVAKAGKAESACLYIGYGQRFLPALFSPPPPPPIQSEYISKFNPDEDESDPIKEQADPLPPADFDDKQVEDAEKKEGDEGDEEDDADLEEEED